MKKKKTPDSVTVNRRAHFVMPYSFRREKIPFSLFGTKTSFKKCLHFVKLVCSDNSEKRQFLWKMSPACREMQAEEC